MSKIRRTGRILSMAATAAMLGGSLIPAMAQAAPSPNGPGSSDRIIGGREVAVGAYPFMASIQTGSRHFCGGSLIDSQTVLTAAHCVNNMSDEAAQNLTVVIGRTSLSDSSQGVTRKLLQSGAITIPQQYGSAAGYDAALLHLAEPVTDITPVSLPSRGNTSLYTPGATATVIGWGTTRPTWPPTYPDRLRGVNVPIQSPQTCANAGGSDYNADTDFCAGRAGKDSCRGDSGGPIMRTVNGRLYQIGIVSWGIGCAQEGNPGFYTSTASQAVWSALGR